MINSSMGRVIRPGRGAMVALVACCSLGYVAPAAEAGQTFLVPSGSLAGGQPVAGMATFSISAGEILISLTNLEANPKSDIQTINGIQFVLSSGQTTGTLDASSALHREINGKGVGAFTDTGPSSTTWNLNSGVNDGFGSGIELTSIGNMGGSPTLIGDPDGTNAYSNANGSLTNHHNFLAGTATFTVDVAGLLADATISSVSFEFGTATGTVSQAIPASVPEPATIVLMGLGLGGAALAARYRGKK